MPNESARLRVGVVCGQHAIQRWQAEAVSRLFAVRSVEPAIWVALDQVAAPPTARADARRTEGTGLLARLTRWLPQPLRPIALNEHSPAQLFGELFTISVPTDGTCTFDAAAIATIAAARLDAVLVLSAVRPDASDLGDPRYGVWTFGPSISKQAPDEDLFSDPKRAALQLIRYDASGEARVLREGRFTGHDSAGAVLKEPPIDAVLMNCALWPAQVAQEVLLGRPDAASGSTVLALTPALEQRGAMAALSVFWKGWRKKLFPPNEVPVMEWNIGLLHQPIDALLDPNASMNVRWLPPPSAGRSRSEPFGYLADDDQLNVLYRKHSVSTGQSSIARLRPKTDNVLKRSRPMLEGAGITGYPYVVLEQGVVYVVVTHTTATDLYRLNPANDGLDRVSLLIDQPLHAPTLFHMDDRWWLFATDPALPDAALLAFHAPKLEGPYTAHAMNPLKLDASCSRPAGTPFQRDGVWYRPTLDASERGTFSVVINRILTLTPDLFAEEPAKRMESFRGTQYGHGVRTLCAMGPITLVDGLRSPVVGASKANASRGKRRSGSSRKRS